MSPRNTALHWEKAGKKERHNLLHDRRENVVQKKGATRDKEKRGWGGKTSKGIHVGMHGPPLKWKETI